MCLSIKTCVLSSYLQPKWVQAGVCPAANWAVSLNLHGIQQVLITETGRPADLKLCFTNTAGTVVVKLENERRAELSGRCSPWSDQWVSYDPGHNEVITTVG